MMELEQDKQAGRFPPIVPRSLAQPSALQLQRPLGEEVRGLPPLKPVSSVSSA